MPSVLITGASRGLGFEFAKQYARDGWSVTAACRDVDGRGAAGLRAMGADVVALDVTDGAAVRALARRMADRPLDLLINNAGVYGPDGGGQSFGAVDVDAWADVMAVNAYAPLVVAQAFADRLAAAPGGGALALLTSKMGSMADNTSGGAYIYRASKAALNAVGKSLAHDLAPRGIKVVLLHPGWVRTDMGGPHGLIDAPESVAGMRAVIAALTPRTSGRFMAYDGREVAW